jgi:hypothetical protein
MEGAAMPHFKCAACRSRLYSSENMSGEVCAGCGGPLEPVGKLSEIVGFRSVESSEGPAASGPRRLADRVGDMKARREAEQAGTGLDPTLWLDDSDRVSAEVSALPTRMET